MTRALILEDFTQPAQAGVSAATATVALPDSPTAAPPDPVDPEVEQAGLDTFDQGYRNGWDDCIANETDERRRIGADLAVALSEVSVSAEKIRTDLLASIAPVLEEIAAQLLPRLAAEAVAPVLIDEVTEIVSGHGPVALELLAAPSKCASIETVLEAATDLPVTVVPEVAFAEGQVSIRFADQRRDIDLSDAADRMSAILRAFAADADSAGPPAAFPSVDIERGVA